MVVERRLSRGKFASFFPIRLEHPSVALSPFFTDLTRREARAPWDFENLLRHVGDAGCPDSRQNLWRDSLFVMTRLFLACALTRIGATCRARRDGADSLGVPRHADLTR